MANLRAMIAVSVAALELRKHQAGYVDCPAVRAHANIFSTVQVILK
jgi:hypothetical protein